VFSRGSADPAEVESKRGDAQALCDLGHPNDHRVVHIAAVQRVRVADHEARSHRLRMGEAGLEVNTVWNLKCNGAFHVMTLRFPAQIIKGGATSKYVEVYCRTCGA
jgi:hypothetical protein